jgi:ABC-type glycerol-3-phosphate transport system substrate-binding protein
MSAGLRLASGLLAVGVLAITAAACGGSPSATSAARGVTCTSYPIHGTGAFHDEVLVQVDASNSTASSADYEADVIMRLVGRATADAPVHVLVKGLVPAGSSAVLSRKVLAAAGDLDCKISRLSRS